MWMVLCHTIELDHLGNILDILRDQLVGVDQWVWSVEDLRCGSSSSTGEYSDDDEIVTWHWMHGREGIGINWQTLILWMEKSFSSLNHHEMSCSHFHMFRSLNHHVLSWRLPRKIGEKHIVKFSEGPCAADTKTDSRRSDRSCSSGVFLQLAKQPRLGLLHQDSFHSECNSSHFDDAFCSL